MAKNKVKEMLRSGRTAIGSWISICDAFSVEAMGGQGFDWLLIDTEHSPIGREGLRNILVALKGSESLPVVRLTSNSADYFKMALDLGAQGIVVPMIESSDDASRAVEYCRYPPAGKRGIGPVRASNYFRELDKYLEEANDEILLVAQIETTRSVQNLEAILEVKGIDGIFIGPADLAGSMGMARQVGHPEVTKVIDHVAATARRLGRPFGLPTWSPEELVTYTKSGATLPLLGGDLRFLMDGAQQNLERARSLLTAKR